MSQLRTYKVSIIEHRHHEVFVRASDEDAALKIANSRFAPPAGGERADWEAFDAEIVEPTEPQTMSPRDQTHIEGLALHYQERSRSFHAEAERAMDRGWTSSARDAQGASAYFANAALECVLTLVNDGDWR